jgi:hypothetical protein
VEPVAVGGRMAGINIPNQVDVEPSSENGEARISLNLHTWWSFLRHRVALVTPGLIDVSAAAFPFQ